MASESSCWPLVSSAVFVPNSASWVLLQQPSHAQATQCLFLSPIALCLSPSRLTFPLPSLSWLHDPPIPPTILFAAFHHVPSQQTHTLALRFPSASHLSQFLASLQTAATLGAHSNPARLTDHSLVPFSFSSDADLHVDPVNSGALEVYSKSLPSSACTARTAADCPVFGDVPVQEAPVSTSSPSLPSILNRQTVTSEPTVYAADSRNLDTSLLCLFPATGRLSIPAASSISASRFSGIHNDHALHGQMCNQSHVASEVEDRQQPSCRRIEDGLDNADCTDPPSFILPLQEASNWPQEQSGLDTRAADIFDTHASEDSESGNLRTKLLVQPKHNNYAQLLVDFLSSIWRKSCGQERPLSCLNLNKLAGCLLDPSFRLLVERVESLVGEIENPANIDLVALADFLALRK